MPITLKHQSSGMCPDSNIKSNILYSMEQIRGVNVSEIRLLFDSSPPPRFIVFFSFASIIPWGVKGVFSILLGGMLLSSSFVSLTSTLLFPIASLSKCSLKICKKTLERIYDVFHL